MRIPQILKEKEIEQFGFTRLLKMHSFIKKDSAAEHKPIVRQCSEPSSYPEVFQFIKSKLRIFQIGFNKDTAYKITTEYKKKFNAINTKWMDKNEEV